MSVFENDDLLYSILDFVDFAGFLKVKSICRKSSRFLFRSADCINYQFFVLDHTVPQECYLLEAMNGNEHSFRYIKSLLDYYDFELVNAPKKVKYLHMSYEGHPSISMISYYLGLYNRLVA